MLGLPERSRPLSGGHLGGNAWLTITRASRVEPDAEGFWWADMGPVDGPVLGPFRALQAESGWLVEGRASVG